MISTVRLKTGCPFRTAKPGARMRASPDGYVGVPGRPTRPGTLRAVPGHFTRPERLPNSQTVPGRPNCPGTRQPVSGRSDRPGTRASVPDAPSQRTSWRGVLGRSRSPSQDATSRPRTRVIVVRQTVRGDGTPRRESRKRVAWSMTTMCNFYLNFYSNHCLFTAFYRVGCDLRSNETRNTANVCHVQ